MDIVVAGATGFIGSRLCESLRDHGHRVTILTRRRAQVEHLCGATMILNDPPCESHRAGPASQEAP